MKAPPSGKRRPPRAARRPGTIQPAWLSPGTVQLEFLDSVLAMYRHPRLRPILLDPISYHSGPHLSVSRTDVAARFLHKTDAEWLLMLDSDMVFDGADVLRLLNASHPESAPVVGGCYHGVSPYIGRTQEWELMRDAPPLGALVPVRVIGTGCLLVHWTVFDRLLELNGAPLPWFAEAVTDDLAVLAEDWEFCRRVREQLHLPVYAHRGVQLGHVKRVTIGRNQDHDALTLGHGRHQGALKGLRAVLRGDV